MKRKSLGDRAVKKSFSLPGRMAMGAEQVCQARGYSAFSDYLQALIREDLQKTLIAQRPA